MTGKYKVTQEFVKEIGEKILNSKQNSLTISADEYFTSIGYNGEKKPTTHIHRAIEEYINKKGPADYYFDVKGDKNDKDFKISLIEKEPWCLIKEKCLKINKEHPR